MSETSIRIQTYVVIGVMLACFSILYPKIFHPMLMHMMGFSQKKKMDEDPFTDTLGPRGMPRPKSFKSSETSTQPEQGKRGGIMTLVLPIYAVGIVIYLLYTLTKVFGSKRKKKCDKKEQFLRDYYRDFHYDTNRGKFRMSHDSSDENEEESSDFNMGTSSMRSSDSKPGQFKWGGAYGEDVYPDIYRSTKSLPRDLERLLMKMENQNIDTDELSQLRVKLEQTEREMTRILKAMQSAEDMIRDSAAHRFTDPTATATDFESVDNGGLDNDELSGSETNSDHEPDATAPEVTEVDDEDTAHEVEDDGDPTNDTVVRNRLPVC